MSHEVHDIEGKTPAAWTTVTVMLIGSIVAAIGFVVTAHWLFWVGVAIIIVGGLIGKVMQMMGLGVPEQPTRPAPHLRDENARADEVHDSNTD
jgi:hypothetical protein